MFAETKAHSAFLLCVKKVLLLVHASILNFFFADGKVSRPPVELTTDTFLSWVKKILGSHPQVERAFAEATASTAKPSSMAEASPHANVKVESGGDPANDALVTTDLRAATSVAEGEGDRGSLAEKPSSADGDLSVTPERAVDRADYAAATVGSPLLPRSRTPGRSPRTPVRTPPTSIPDSTRHFFKPSTARRYTGYRALLAYGARTPFERESQFLAGQM